MIFKTHKISEEWKLLEIKNPLLYGMAMDAEGWLIKEAKKTPVCTSIYRSDKEQIKIYPAYYKRFRKPRPSVHMYWRGLDIRTIVWQYKGYKRYYEPMVIEGLLEYINKKYMYDPKRLKLKCLDWHTVPTSVEHLHFQTHPRSYRVYE